MHIPNGFLSDPVCTVSTVAAVAAVGVGAARLRQSDASRSSALMAATGAGIFAAQMVNFPVASGTSGHVLGAALAAIVLGPWRGMLTMALVLLVQCLVFGDGGASTLGANVFNMAVAGTLAGYALYTLATRALSGAPGKVLGAAVAAFGSVLVAAALCSIELAASGTYAFGEVFSAMMGVHLTIALSEAVFTVALVAAALALKLEARPLSPRGVMIGGLALAVAVAGLLAPLASSAPDGLERVAEDLGFANLATASMAIVPDYEAPGISVPALAVALAGILGVACVVASTYTLDRTVKVRVRKQ